MYKHIAPSDFEDVGRFHRKFGLAVSEGRPLHTPREVLEFRMKFLLEEVLEFIDAAGYRLTYTEKLNEPGRWGVEKVTDEVDHAKMFDALIDEVYVALGTAHLLGYPWAEGWFLVQEANMNKVRATEETASERGGTFDVIKPPGWVAPDIAGLLRECGWGDNK